MMHRSILGSGAIAILLAGCLPAHSGELSDYEQLSGWKMLFDGKSLAGWRGFQANEILRGWRVADGSIQRGPDAKSDLVTVDAFDHFELSLEYRIEKGASGGVLFRVDEKANDPRHSGPEIEIVDNQAKHAVEQAGWLVGLYPASKRWPDGEKPVDAVRPAGEWNHLQLLAVGNHCEVNLNGTGYYQFNLGDDDWKKRVAASPFSKYENFGKADKGLICLQGGEGTVSFRNIKLRELPANGAAREPIHGTLAVQVEPAFPKLRWAGWQPVNDGLNEPFRPIVITHAGDGSNRIFVVSQHGTIYVFKNDQDVTESKVFLNIRDKVRYSDAENEEGFLGLAFHPRYKETGAFFAYYTVRDAPHLCMVSRFRVSKDDPDKADPASEERLLRIPQPFWNHKGGTLAFGPDGFLYIGLGDGGSANDPHGNGQNLNTLLGSILRIDVDQKSGDLPYAIPADNPFVGRKNARPEIFAYGFRNVWRLSFDRQTQLLWAADVGQNLWEEINIVSNGGNYGWSFREGTHPFGPTRQQPLVNLIDPIWEYDHQVGKSITGRVVYRGQGVPELLGKYLYADYVTGKIWALDYDSSKRRVLGNYRVESPMLPIITFGEDEPGEVYVAIVAPDGKGLYRFAPK